MTSRPHPAACDAASSRLAGPSMAPGWRRHAALALAAVVTAGCEDVTPPQGHAEAGSAAAAPAAPSAWQRIDGSRVVAVEEAAIAAELAGAAARARASAPAAALRWQAAGPAERARWAVKWAAPTVAGSVEHVWVLPRSWSAFRVEGILASAPRRELQPQRRSGEAVAFPIEELADWVHLLPDGTREGGLTMDVLEARLGAPAASGG